MDMEEKGREKTQREYNIVVLGNIPVNMPARVSKIHAQTLLKSSDLKREQTEETKFTPGGRPVNEKSE